MESENDTGSTTEPELPYLVSAPLRQRLDLVHHLLEFGNRIVLIEADEGSGRTRMLESACAEADAGWSVLQPDAGAIDSAAALLQFTGTGLGLAADDAGQPGPEFEGEIIRVLERMHEDHELALIAIDDADDLPDEALDTLFRLAHSTQGTGHLRVVLTASRESGLTQRIQERTPEPALVHLVDVPPLSTAQIAELADIFARDHTVPDPEAVARTTAGNPERVIAALRIASSRRAEPASPAGSALSRRKLGALVIAGAIVVALVATLALRRGSPPATGVETIEVSLPDDSRAPLAESPDDAPAVALPLRAAPEYERRAGDGNAASAESIEPAGAEPPGQKQTPSTASAALPDAEQGPAAADDAPGETGAADAGPPADDDGTAPTGDGDPAFAAGTTGSGAGAGVSAAAPPPGVTSTSTPTATPDPVPEPPAVPAPTSDSTPGSGPDPVPPLPSSAASPRNPTADTTVYSTQWVLTQSPRSYVIQLFGVRERAAAVRFLREQAGVMPGAIVELTHEDAPWYVVIVGHYPNRAAALSAISELPPSLSRFRPWARPVHSLKE